MRRREKRSTWSYWLLVLGLCLTPGTWGQLAMQQATLGITLPCSGGSQNRSGLAFNSDQQLYYSVNAGNIMFPIETFDLQGNQLDWKSQAFDYRGIWWNPNTNELEGNGYAEDGIWIQSMSASGMPLSAGSLDLSNVGGPEDQGCAAYCPEDDEVIYYYDGTIYRYQRSDMSLIASVVVATLPTPNSNLNVNSVGYTGVKNGEIALFDHVNAVVHFVSKSTGQYKATCLLPQSAPRPNKFGMALTNHTLFLFDKQDMQWQGYQIVNPLGVSLPEEEALGSVTVYPNPVGDELNVNLGSNAQGVNLEVWDMTGRLIKAYTVVQGDHCTLDVSDLAKGTFSLHVVTGENASWHRFVRE